MGNFLSVTLILVDILIVLDVTSFCAHEWFFSKYVLCKSKNYYENVTMQCSLIKYVCT